MVMLAMAELLVVGGDGILEVGGGGGEIGMHQTLLCIFFFYVFLFSLNLCKKKIYI